MPVLDFPVLPPTPTGNTILLPVLAVMLYPQNAGRRESWLAAAMARAYAVGQQEGYPEERLREFHKYIAALWRLPLAPTRVFQDGASRIQRALLCGQMLRFLLSLAHHHQRHCTVERARLLTIEFIQPQVSESLLEKAWPEFKPAVHLWSVIDEILGPDGIPNSSDERSLEIVGLAESCRRVAEEARLLDQREMWVAPKGSGTPPVEVVIQQLPKEMLAFLDRSFPV